MNFIEAKNGGSLRSKALAKLWINQKEALQRIESYLLAPTNQCLIRMPTGSGKTAVMAVLAQLSADHRHVLVIAPWDHLISQLKDEISEVFWDKTNLRDQFEPARVIHFTPASFDDDLKKVDERGVLICTNQALELLQREHEARYSQLAQWASLVLVDEGHREPAPQWAVAIRLLEKPTVLFTATPYRNDSRLFQFDAKFTYAYTFPRAVRERIIRDIVFTEAKWGRGRDEAKSFAKEIRGFRADRMRSLSIPSSDFRVIVHCRTCERVEAVVSALEAEGESAIGIHEQFSGRSGTWRNQVPDAEDTEAASASYWVHQWKLLEGLDDSRFRVVALFDGFPNGRNLVQQVGRVVRNPRHSAGEKALVISHVQDRQRQNWEGFLAYESGAQKLIDQGQEIPSLPDAIRAERDSLRSFYLKGQFRRHLRVADVTDPREFARLRLSVVVLKPRAKITLNQVIEAIEDDIVQRDAVTYGQAWKDAEMYLQLYEMMEPSEVASELYLETRIAYSFAWLTAERLYLADSEGAVPEGLRKCCGLIPLEELARALPDQQATIGEITLLNGDLGPHTVRRKTLATDSLSDVPPTLSDYHHVCTTATGRVDTGQEILRRYVGFSRSRISERTARPLEYAEFEVWLRSLGSSISNQTIDGDNCLGRFAEAARYDGKSKLGHILFDLDLEAIDHEALVSTPPPADPSELWRVDSNGEMVGVIDQKYFSANVAWDSERRIFNIKSSALSSVEILNPETGKNTTLERYLNSTQSFRALLGGASHDLLYMQRRFFRPNSTPWLGGRERFDLINIVYVAGSLDVAVSEKGGDNDPVWPADSVFGSIFPVDRPDGIFAQMNFTPDVLICQDIATVPEIADFFAYTENPRRLIQIQCKVAGENSRMSASAFHELCSQTVRYLAFFNPVDALSKLKVDKIRGNWSIGARSRPRLLVNKDHLSAIEIKERIDQLARDPSCMREVWMVMGQGLSRGDLESAVKPGTRPPVEVRHMVYLLQSTWSTVASVGVSLRVFCRS